MFWYYRPTWFCINRAAGSRIWVELDIDGCLISFGADLDSALLNDPFWLLLLLSHVIDVVVVIRFVSMNFVKLSSIWRHALGKIFLNFSFWRNMSVWCAFGLWLLTFIRDINRVIIRSSKLSYSLYLRLLALFLLWVCMFLIPKFVSLANGEHVLFILSVEPSNFAPFSNEPVKDRL
jgi:hypothetical protein